jgi:hypothetical protein
VGVAEIEVIIAKAISAATEVICTEFEKALKGFHERLNNIEIRCDDIEKNVQNPTVELRELPDRIDATMKEMRQFALAANQSKQYPGKNNLRIKGLKVNGTDKENCRKLVAEFIRSSLSLPIEESEIELAHPLPVSSAKSSGLAGAVGT